MNAWRFVWQTLLYHWRTNLSVFLGIVTGAAVLSGALIVGDSVRASLRRLTVERLGRIDEVLLAENFLRPELAATILSTSDVTRHYEAAVPAIFLPNVSVEFTARDGSRARIGGTTLVGCDESFWTLAATDPRPQRSPGVDEIVVNRPLADELKLQIGDKVLVRIGKQGGIAADSLLADKSDRTITLAQLQVIEILPATGLGRFSLQANQQLPTNAFVQLAVLQQAMQREGRVNAILFAGRRANEAPSDEAFATLRQSLQPALADLGLQLKHVNIGFQADGRTEFVSQYESLSSDAMIFSPAADAAVRRAIANLPTQPALTYVANRIEKLQSDGQPTAEVVPYSMVTAIDSQPELGPLDIGGHPFVLQDDEIALNGWTASALHAEIGDQIRLSYFDPETTHGDTIERQAVFTLRHIAPLVAPAEPFRPRRPARFDKRPSLANDPDLTPEVAGITDQDSIEDWNTPFPLDHQLLSRRDDEYWRDYRTTPKAFVSLSAGRKLWQSRFGQTTSFRIPSDDAESNARLASELASRMANDTDAFGVRWLRVKRDGLQASAGTTPFDALFLGFSFFIIAAASMLVSLLFRLGMEQRANSIGLITALGFTSKQVSGLLLREAAILALSGSFVGSLLGIAYAWLMLAGLRTWWVAAVATPFMQLAIRPATLLLGATFGTACSLLTVWWTLRRLRRLSVRRLMSGRAEEEFDPASSGSTGNSWVRWLIPGLACTAVGLSVMALFLSGEAQAGAFFGTGATVLATLILLIISGLRHSAGEIHRRNLGISWLARRNMARNPGRSALTIGLMASACFLIIAISSFRVSPADQGTGGFAFVGTSDQPIFTKFTDPASRAEAFRLHADTLRSATVIALRMQDGDDASCRNLYQSRRPRLLGVSAEFIRHFEPTTTNSEAAEKHVGRFAFAATAASDAAEHANPWRLLADADAEVSEAIPVIIDKNTAMYGLHLYGGIGQEFELDYAANDAHSLSTDATEVVAVAGSVDNATAAATRKLKFRVVGLLSNSILQGSMLIRESDLVRCFPRVAGYRYLLVNAAENEAVVVGTALEDAYADQGLDLTDARRLLGELLAVQNTYISTFQSLGGLGLLLGTFGLVAVQLRNVMQRRGELALMRATGFRQAQLVRLVMWEHSLLLFGGLLTGIVAALTAVLPHILFADATVPWGTLAIMLTIIAALGLLTGRIAVRYVNHMKLLPALRSE